MSRGDFYDMIPAQPGWFAFDWTVPTKPRWPIIAWIVDSRSVHKQLLQKQGQGWSRVPTTAYPVTTCGIDRTGVVIGPDGTVYELASGRTWPDVDSFVKVDESEYQAEFGNIAAE